MTVAEILEKVKFVVNPTGKKSAVLVDMDIWEQIVAILEDLEDAEDVKTGAQHSRGYDSLE